MPRYSAAISAGMLSSIIVQKSPSTSDSFSPASASAARPASAMMS